MRIFGIVTFLIIAFLLYVSLMYGDVDLTNSPGSAPVAAQSTERSLWDLLATPAPVAQSALVQSQPAGVPVTGGAPCPTPVVNAVPVTGACPQVPAVPVTGGCTAGCGYYPGYVYYPSIPVTGGCPNPLMVQYGDTLSRISRACGTNVPALLALNPYIYNPDLIYPGQVLWVYPPAGTTGVPVTGPIIAPTPVPVEVNPIVLVPSTSPILGGTGMQVKVTNFPANTPVSIGVGKLGMGYQLVNAGITDATGTLISSITLPPVDNPLDQWTVVVITTAGTPVQVASQPFTISQ